METTTIKRESLEDFKYRIQTKTLTSKQLFSIFQNWNFEDITLSDLFLYRLDTNKLPFKTIKFNFIDDNDENFIKVLKLETYDEPLYIFLEYQNDIVQISKNPNKILFMYNEMLISTQL